MFIYSSAYPLAGLCALLNNLIEIRRWAFSQQQQQHSINTTIKKKTDIRNNNRRWNDNIDNEQIKQQQQQQLWHNTIKTTKAKTPVTMITTATTTTKGTKEQKHICNTNNNNNKKDSKTNNGFRIEIFLQIQNKAVAKYIFSDAFKLCYIHQRPFPQRVDSIGSWQTAMEVLPWYSSLSILKIKIYGLGNGIHSCAGELWVNRALWAGSQNLPQHHRQSNGDLSSLWSTW